MCEVSAKKEASLAQEAVCAQMCSLLERLVKIGSSGALAQDKSGRNATFGAHTFAHAQAYRVHAHALNSTYMAAVS